MRQSPTSLWELHATEKEEEEERERGTENPARPPPPPFFFQENEGVQQLPRGGRGGFILRMGIPDEKDWNI